MITKEVFKILGSTERVKNRRKKIYEYIIKSEKQFTRPEWLKILSKKMKLSKYSFYDDLYKIQREYNIPDNFFNKKSNLKIRQQLINDYIKKHKKVLSKRLYDDLKEHYNSYRTFTRDLKNMKEKDLINIKKTFKIVKQNKIPINEISEPKMKTYDVYYYGLTNSFLDSFFPVKAKSKIEAEKKVYDYVKKYDSRTYERFKNNNFEYKIHFDLKEVN